MRCYQYLQAPVQEHIAAHSRAEYLVAQDLVLPQRASGRVQAESGPEVMRDDLEAPVMATDIERNLDSGLRIAASSHGDEGSETDNQITLGRLRNALEQYRRSEEQQARGEASMRIQECVLWLTSSRRGLEQLEAVLITNDVGTRACNAMRAWWIRHEVNTPRQACAYMQGINQAAQTDEIYGEVTTQVID